MFEEPEQRQGYLFTNSPQNEEKLLDFNNKLKTALNYSQKKEVIINVGWIFIGKGGVIKLF